jgi:hypothetical protein
MFGLGIRSAPTSKFLSSFAGGHFRELCAEDPAWVEQVFQCVRSFQHPTCRCKVLD